MSQGGLSSRVCARALLLFFLPCNLLIHKYLRRTLPQNNPQLREQHPQNATKSGRGLVLSRVCARVIGRLLPPQPVIV